MKIEIKSVFGSVLFAGDFESVAAAVVAAVKDRADLRSAYLGGAYLSGADLSGAYLSGADLSGADLSGAYLSGADLSGACLGGAYLGNADLSGANLRRADLRRAKNAQLAIAKTRILPEGDLIGWKKCVGGIIVKLLIPQDAKRSHAFGRKCRAEFVKVVEVVGEAVATSMHDRATKYRAGEIVRCDKWCENFQEECAGGIHFFITREEAEAYT